MLKVTGKTQEGGLVVSGVFSFYETHGIPLDVLFEGMLSNSFTPDWVGFYHEAMKAGLKPVKIFAMLNESVSDTFGTTYRDIVLDRLKRYHELKGDQ